MRLVLDTNIVMDMLHFANPHTAPLLATLVSGRYRCFTDEACLAELERVCTYPEFRLDPTAQAALLDRYRQLALRCDAAGEENYLLPRCRDRDDQKFLILAARSQADLLITRDKMLLRLARNRRRPPTFRILTAEATVSLLQLAPEHPAPII